jgi:hypothetical protein
MAVTAAAATGTMTAGAIIAATSGHAATIPEPKTPDVHPVADVAPVQANRLHVVDVPFREWVTVHGGDTLSGIARDDCGSVRYWSGIYVTNEKEIGADYNLIQPGQKLELDCTVKKVPVIRVQVHPLRAVTQTYRSSRASSGGHHHVYGGYSGNVNPGSYSGYQQCVITRESGGRSQVMNASGHYGLYQFDYGTWVSGGGAGADFGHASVSEQNRVFAAVYAARGTQPWSPSDGC